MTMHEDEQLKYVALKENGIKLFHEIKKEFESLGFEIENVELYDKKLPATVKQKVIDENGNESFIEVPDLFAKPEYVDLFKHPLFYIVKKADDAKYSFSCRMKTNCFDYRHRFITPLFMLEIQLTVEKHQRPTHSNLNSYSYFTSEYKKFRTNKNGKFNVKLIAERVSESIETERRRKNRDEEFNKEKEILQKNIKKILEHFNFSEDEIYKLPGYSYDGRMKVSWSFNLKKEGMAEKYIEFIQKMKDLDMM